MWKITDWRNSMDDSRMLFEDLSTEAQQQLANFIYKEIFRHHDDIERAYKELAMIERKTGIKPCNIYIDKWIEVRE